MVSDRAPGSLFELFRSPEGDAFVDLYVQGHRETYAVTSQQFRHRLTLIMLEHTGEAPTGTELKRRIELFQAKAVQPETPEREVYFRTACVGDRIYIDLADSTWSVIEIATDGWRIVQIPPVRFIRTPGMSPLPMPQSGGSLETFRNLLNVRDDDNFVLVVAWLLNALAARREHPVLVLNGGEGSAKSTLVAILQALTDPSCIPLGGLPRVERQLLAQASRSYLQVFDNISTLSIPMSDALCRLSTGDGARPIILNSIEEVVTRADLADRCLFIACEFIPDERRRPAAELWGEFERAHPQIFGLLLDALSHGLRMLPETHLDRLPRMADFALWATACEGALWPQGTFAAFYDTHRAEAVKKLIGADLVASAVRQLAAKRHVWTGTASELDTRLRALTGNVDFPKAWPSDPARLATRLRQLASSLNKIGIHVSFTRSGHDRTRLIAISTRTSTPDELPSAPSASSCETFETASEGFRGDDAAS